MPEPWFRSDRRSTTSGVALSLAAAATFGVLAPASKGALAHVGPLRGAALAYLAAGGAALVALLLARTAGGRPWGRPAARVDLPRLLGMTVLGGILGPALFFAGVARLAAHQVAVLQHLEFGLTVLAAVLVLGERPGRRGVAGLVLIGMGVLLLSILDVGRASGADFSWIGRLLLVGGCMAWACDNTLARGASRLDPLLVVSIKGLGAGIVLTLASVGHAWPVNATGWGLVALAGGVGVGASLVLELLALRHIGAALNAGLFATGPAFGFVWSLLFLGERSTGAAWAALAACVVGAVLLAVDRRGEPRVPAR